MLEEISQFWSFCSEILGLTLSQPVNSKFIREFICSMFPATLDSLSHDFFLKKTEWSTQNFRYPELKIKYDFLSSSVVQDTILHSLCIIGSTRYLTFARIFRCISKRMPIIFVFSILSKYFSRQFAEMCVT